MNTHGHEHTHTHTQRQERVGSVAANLDTPENSKEAGGGVQGTQGLSKNCISSESVFPLSRLIIGFHHKFLMTPHFSIPVWSFGPKITYVDGISNDIF